MTVNLASYLSHLNLTLLYSKPQQSLKHLLAEAEGAVMGFVNIGKSAHPKYPMYRPREFAMIENVVVDKACRSQGVGRSLFEAAKRWAEEHGLRYVQTLVWSVNASAREFYGSEGFEPMTERLELDLGAKTTQ